MHPLQASKLEILQLRRKLTSSRSLPTLAAPLVPGPCRADDEPAEGRQSCNDRSHSAHAHALEAACRWLAAPPLTLHKALCLTCPCTIPPVPPLPPRDVGQAVSAI